MTQPLVQQLDSNANPVSGAAFYFYLSGTTTPTPVYADAALTTPLTQPVVADASGRMPNVYYNSDLSYRLVIKSEPGGTTIRDIDPFNPAINLVSLGAQRVLYADIMMEPYASLIVGNDITAAVQAAVDQAKIVRLPDGANWICGFVNITLNETSVTGPGSQKCNLTRPSGSNNWMFYASGVDDLSFSGFSTDGNPAGNALSGAHAGIRLENCDRPTITNVGGSGWYGTYLGDPVGAAFSVSSGVGGRFDSNLTFECGDGLVVADQAGASDSNSIYTNTRRFGLLVDNCDGFRDYNITANGNAATLSSGGGIAILNSDDCESHSPSCGSNVLGPGKQISGCNRYRQFGGRYDGNGTASNGDGLAIYNSPDCRIYGGSGASNKTRGLSIDSGSDGSKAFGFDATDNDDVDLHVFRSANVALIDCTGETSRVDDSGVLQAAAVASGGAGYTVGDVLSLTSGRGGVAPQVTVATAPAGVIATVTVTRGGDWWDRPSNPASFSGGTGAGATFNLTWLGAGTNLCAGFTRSGGGEGETMKVAGGFTSPSMRLDRWKGTLSDTASALKSADGCDSVTVPLTLLTLAASWVAFDPAWQAPAYFKDAEGWVHLVGTMKNGTTTSGTVIGTLPTGFHPANTVGPWQTFGVGASVSLYVDSAGQIIAQSALNATRTALDGIKFKAA
ncbi:hypothetical protein [Caulobacter sp. AP07]|uniref:hypothetical protein n=1 Tax=Caulobacter sp. AP07 TaxID=1144304 RepID=UPI000557C41D|nr:hypothetical protein [Caulobacter sp. AP07]